MIIIDKPLRAAVEAVSLDNRNKRCSATAFAIVLLERIRAAESADRYVWGNFNDQTPGQTAAIINTAISALFDTYHLHYLRENGVVHHLREIDFWDELAREPRLGPSS